MYEIFERKAPRMGIPMMTFTTLGQIAFNQPAARILQKEPVETILLLWDKTGKKLAMKSTLNKKDTRSYTIRYNDKGNGASFSAKTFLDFTGIDISTRKAMPITINMNSEYFIEVTLPDEFFKKDGIQSVPVRKVAS